MPEFPRAVPSWPDLVPLSQDDVLELFDRILPSHYLEPLKSPGPGYEYLQAVAAMIARVSEAIAHVGSGSYIGSATGGSYATALIYLERPDTTFGEVTLLGLDQSSQPTLVGTAEGYTYALENTVTIGATETSVGPILIRATTRGWMWNRPGPFTTSPPDNELVPGPINRLIRPMVPTPAPPAQPNFDPTLRVRQFTAAVGGSSNMLDGLGDDRGLPRQFSGITQVRLQRATPGDAFRILPGTILATDRGFRYQTTEIVDFATDDTRQLPVAVVPVFANLIANRSPITTVVSVNYSGTPPSGAGLVVAYSPTPEMETDASYRIRLTQLPVTITPAAIRATVEKALGPLTSSVGVREIWDFRYQSAYDLTFSTGGTPTMREEANLNAPCPEYNGAVFVYDYVQPDDSDPQQMLYSQLSNRYLGATGERGAVVVYLPGDLSVNGSRYNALASLLEQVKPAGATMLYVTDLP